MEQKDINKITNFKIILTGFVKPEVTLQEAEQNLGKLLNAEPARIQMLLNGQPTTIKRNITTEYIDQYKQALNKTGVEFYIVSDVPEILQKNIVEAEIPSAVTPKLPQCPKCGYQAKDINDQLVTKYDGMGECPKCGVVPKSYLKTQREQKNLHEKNLEKDNHFNQISTNFLKTLTKLNGKISPIILGISSIARKSKTTTTEKIKILTSRKSFKVLVGYISIGIVILILGYFAMVKYSSQELSEVKNALNKIRAATEVGVTYLSYQKLLIDAKGKINSVHVTDKRLNNAMEMYIDAMKVWKFKNEDTHGLIISGTELGDELIAKYQSELSSIIDLENGQKAGYTDMILQELWEKAGQQLKNFD